MPRALISFTNQKGSKSPFLIGSLTFGSTNRLKIKRDFIKQAMNFIACFFMCLSKFIMMLESKEGGHVECLKPMDFEAEMTPLCCHSELVSAPRES
jgi:hypothetical protein